MALKRFKRRRSPSKLVRIIQISMLVLLLLFIVGIRANVFRLTSGLLQSIGTAEDVKVEGTSKDQDAHRESTDE